MSLTYFLNDLEMVPVAPIITGITLVFTFHMRCISIVRSLYFKIFSAFFQLHFYLLGLLLLITCMFSLLLLLLLLLLFHLIPFLYNTTAKTA